MYVQVLPEYGLVVDPTIGVVTTAGESLAPVIEKVADMEAVADDIVNMLSGKGNFLASFPNRENALPTAGAATPTGTDWQSASSSQGCMYSI